MKWVQWGTNYQQSVVEQVSKEVSFEPAVKEWKSERVTE